MSIDEALLNSFIKHNSQPLLRIYGWNPPALSVGRFQNVLNDIDIDMCRRNKLQVVRRITGGGALYHASEITYSLVCAPEHIPATSSSIKESFRTLTGFLLTFYRNLGLDACYSAEIPENTYVHGERTPFCFAGRELLDITVNGRKIGGNAQRRLRNVVFQHGSIPLTNCAATGLSFMNRQTCSVNDDITSLIDCGLKFDISRLSDLLKSSFEQHMNVDLKIDTMLKEEIMLADQLCCDKYSKEKWNLYGEMS